MFDDPVGIAGPRAHTASTKVGVDRAQAGTLECVAGHYWMGWTHFLMRGMENVRTEFSLSVLAYNVKRVISILGIAKTIVAMKLVGG